MVLMPMILTTILSMALKGSFSGDDFNLEPVSIAVVRLYDEKKDSIMLELALSSNFIAQGMGDSGISDRRSSDGSAYTLRQISDRD